MNMGHPGSGPYIPPKSGNSTIIIVVVAVAVLGFIFISAILAAILFPVFARAREKARESACLHNVVSISAAARMYQDNWNSTYPPAGNWNDLLSPMMKEPNALVCPAITQSTEPCYALNGKLSGKPVAIVRDQATTVAIYESQPGRNMAGGPELLPLQPRHMGGDTIGFADGHAQWFERSRAAGLNWNP